MAGNPWAMNTSGKISLTGTVAKTVLQVVAASNVRARIKRLRVGFFGTSATTVPALVELVRQTDAGTMTGNNPTRTAPGAETLQTTGQRNATVEPTSTTVVWSQGVHQQDAREFVINDMLLAGGERLGLRITSPDNVDVVANIDGEE